MSCADTVGIIKDSVLTVGAVVGIIVAILGLSTWRRQLKGSSEYDLARRLLKATYQFRGAIQNVRAIGMMDGEIQTALERHGPKDRLPQGKDASRAVYARRWERVCEARENLDPEALEAEVIWGKEVRDLLAPILGCSVDLWMAMHLFLSDKEDNESESELKRRDEARKMMYIGGDEARDPLTHKLNKAVDQIESFARPYLAKK
jgi:hypothetical protein